ncbi:MAG: hypothetical protein AAGA12_02535 [Pseudomonadota bacterium]
MPSAKLSAGIGLICLMACSTDLPKADATISAQARAAALPSLLPIDSFIDASVLEGTQIELDSVAVQARIRALRARAAALQGRDIYEGQDRLRNLTR